MAETLVEKVCTPCRGGVSPLTREEEAERYLDLVQDWELLDDARLIRTASVLILGRGSTCVRLGHHGEVGGKPSQQQPPFRERLVRTVQRSTGADRHHDRLVRRTGEAHQAEVDVPLLPARTGRAWTQGEQLDRSGILPPIGYSSTELRPRFERRVQRGCRSR